MLLYNGKLKARARQLRRQMTDAECTLWQRLRNKQVCGVSFYRQKPIDQFIVDFYCPAVSLAVEVDGGTHLSAHGIQYDSERTARLASLGLVVIRFDNRQVLTETDAVMASIAEVVASRLAKVQENPPVSPFAKGGKESSSAKGEGSGIAEGDR